MQHMSVGKHYFSLHANILPLYLHVLWYVLWYILMVCNTNQHVLNSDRVVFTTYHNFVVSIAFVFGMYNTSNNYSS